MTTVSAARSGAVESTERTLSSVTSGGVVHAPAPTSAPDPAAEAARDLARYMVEKYGRWARLSLHRTVRFCAQCGRALPMGFNRYKHVYCSRACRYSERKAA